MESLSSASMCKDLLGSWSEPDSLSKIQYQRSASRRELSTENKTDHIFQLWSESAATELPQRGTISKSPTSLLNETIREWWVGEVLEVHSKDRYFSARLRDLKKNESIAEFDFDAAFDNDMEMEQCLFPGAEFAFYVVTRHGQGSPETVSSLEFTSPYVWREGDDSKVEKLYSILFSEE
jgi:hypothetical protein